MRLPLPGQQRLIGFHSDNSGYYDTSTNQYLLGARYYEPLTGRFTQEDPSGQEVNLYTYAADDPMNMVDPSGLSSVSSTVLAVLAGLLTTILDGLICTGIWTCAIVVAAGISMVEFAYWTLYYVINKGKSVWTAFIDAAARTHDDELAIVAGAFSSAIGKWIIKKRK